MAAPRSNVEDAVLAKKENNMSEKKTVKCESTSSGGDMKNSNSVIPSHQFEDKFYNMLMSPILDQMEQSANQSNELLDEVLKQIKDEKELAKKKQLSAHIPHLLQGSGPDVSDILCHLEKMIEFENYNKDEKDESKLVKAHVKQPSVEAQFALISHSIAAYVSMFDSQHLRHLATHVVHDTSLWLVKLFRFNESAAYFHEEEREGIVRICQFAIHKKFPKYTVDGYEALYSRPPVIYINGAAKPSLGQHICHQLGLPLSCVSNIPADETDPTSQRMNISHLEQLITNDVNGGKTPVIVIASAGSHMFGQMDDLTRLNTLCKERDIWLHSDGTVLARLAASVVSETVSPALLCGSITLNLSLWLGLPALPFVTLFRSSDVSLIRAAGLGTLVVRYKLSCLTLWMCLQQLGYDHILSRILCPYELVRQMAGGIEPLAVNGTLYLFRSEGPVVIFRYQKPHDIAMTNGDELVNDTQSDATSKEALSALSSIDAYVNTLNTWLVETLRRQVGNVPVGVINVDNVGTCIRYSPLESSSPFDTTREDIENFVECLHNHIKILDATLRMKLDFGKIVEAQDNMLLVDLPSWAGLGAIQYIPEPRMSEIDNLSEAAKKEINIINHQMVNQLKSTDTAFSLGLGNNELFCVRFGLVTDDTDLEELIAMVYTAGKDLEESSKYIETMAETVRQGIEKACNDLVQENQARLMQEGVLRQVPLVGSLINWWSPPPKDPIRGRTFNLSSGKIVSTEDTYKYHVQVQETIAEPPPKVRDGPLKTNLKPARHTGRERSDSQTSSVSHSSSVTPASPTSPPPANKV